MHTNNNTEDQGDKDNHNVDSESKAVDQITNNSNQGNEHRKKRVKRIKAAIILTGLILLILPTILCIILGIQVKRLQNQMKDLIEIHSEYGLIYEDSEQFELAYAAEKSNPDNLVQSDKENELNKNEYENKINDNKTNDNETNDNETNDNETNDNETNDNETNDNETNDYKTNDYKTNDNEANDYQIIKESALAIDQLLMPQNSSSNQLKVNTKPSPTLKPVKPTVTPAPTKALQDKKETQQEDNEANKGKYADHTVYLTFDDGPSIYTSEILDIFAEYQVKATFFVVGKTDETSKELYQRIVNEGHTLGMHSYSHDYSKIYNSVEEFDKDFTKLWKLLYDTTGYKPSIYRFPGGSSNSVNKHGMEKFIHYLNEASIIYYDWNVLNGDATGVSYTEEELIDNVLSGVAKKKRSIVLLHDSKSKRMTVDSLPGLLEELIEGGAQILPLDNNVKPIQMIRADSVN